MFVVKLLFVLPLIACVYCATITTKDAKPEEPAIAENASSDDLEGAENYYGGYPGGFGGFGYPRGFGGGFGGYPGGFGGYPGGFGGYPGGGFGGYPGGFGGFGGFRRRHGFFG